MITTGKLEEIRTAESLIQRLNTALMIVQSGDNGDIPLRVDDEVHRCRKALAQLKATFHEYEKNGL